MGEAGIEVPELRCPTTPATFASTSFCATVAPTFGSSWSSSATSANLAALPPILMPAALASSIARRAPFSLSLPRWALPPVSGATWPILISVVSAEAAGAPPSFLAVCGVSLLQPAASSAAASSEQASLVFIGSPRVLALWGRYLTPAPSRKSTALLLRQHPLDERLDVRVGHLAVGRHGYLAPDALAALLHLVEQLRFGARVVAVLGGDVLVGRADQLLVRGMAGEAVVLLGKLLLRIGGQRSGARQGEEQYSSFHDFSLHAVFNCM